MLRTGVLMNKHGVPKGRLWLDFATLSRKGERGSANAALASATARWNRFQNLQIRAASVITRAPAARLI